MVEGANGTRWARAENRPARSEIFVWNGGLDGPSTASEAPDGTIMLEAHAEGSTMAMDVDDFKCSGYAVPEVCMTESLARRLGSQFVYEDRCSLDLVSWSALSTGIGSPFAQARTLRLLLTARWCCVRRLRSTTAGSIRSTARRSQLLVRRRMFLERTVDPRRADAIDPNEIPSATQRRKRVLPRAPNRRPSRGRRCPLGPSLPQSTRSVRRLRRASARGTSQAYGP